MPAPVPVLGYRSKTAAIRALSRQGLSAADIAPKLGLTEKQIYNLVPPVRSLSTRKAEAAATRREQHVSDSGREPTGPFTYAERRPSSLLDELLFKIAMRQQNRTGARFFRLRRSDGAYLAEDGMRFVDSAKGAGAWTVREIVRMQKQNPSKRQLQAEAIN